MISIHDFSDTRAVLFLASQLVVDYIDSSYTPQEDKDMEVNTVELPCATISCKRQPSITEPA